MKQIVTLLAITLLTQSINAQTNYTPTGTWKYISGTDTLEVFFKTDQLNLGTTVQPIIIGFHKYIKNGVLIENTLNHSSTNYSNNLFSILVYNFKENDARNDGTIKDITLNNKRYLILTKLTPTSMNVRLTYIQGVRNNKPLGFTLPRNFQLIKQ